MPEGRRRWGGLLEARRRRPGLRRASETKRRRPGAAAPGVGGMGCDCWPERWLPRISRVGESGQGAGRGGAYASRVARAAEKDPRDAMRWEGQSLCAVVSVQTALAGNGCEVPGLS